MTRLARRKRQPMGVRNGPERRYRGHLQEVRGYCCIVPNCATGDRIQACHVRSETDGGISFKPSDWWTWPGCETHHAEQGNIGEGPFERKYGVDLKATATMLARQSRFKEVREMAGVRITERART